MARKISGALGAAGVVLGLLALAPPSHAAAAGEQVCSTVVGSDGRYVRALVGIVLYQGTTVLDYDATSTYSLAEVELNPDLPSDQGVEPGSPDDTGYTDEVCFADVPIEVDGYRLEVLPLDGAGATSYARYGGASRPKTSLPVGGLPLPGAATVLPLRCEEGGNTGSITAEAFSSGSPTNIGQVRVTSEGASPTSGIAGFATVGEPAGGANGPITPVVVGGLEPNQRYAVEVTFANRARRALFTEIAVRPCETTTVRAWAGATPGGTPGRWTTLAKPVSGTYLPVPGDFTGDGRDDVFWYAPGPAADHLWISTGAGFTSRQLPVNGVYRPTAGDYDGDGVDDLFFYGPGTAPDQIWYFDEGGLTYSSVAVTAEASLTTRAYSGDFDGNGVDDVLFYSPNGADSVWRHQLGGGRTAASIAISTASNIAVGDVNGDLRDDIVQQSTLTGGMRIFLGAASGGFTETTDSTARTYRPIVADLSCDLRADVVMYQPGPALDLLWRTRAPVSPFFAKSVAALGVNGSYLFPFVGDFDGNGCDDIFWYQPGPPSDHIWLNQQIGWHPPTATLNQGPY